MNNVLWLQLLLGVVALPFGGFFISFAYWSMFSKDKTVNKLFMVSGLVDIVLGLFLIAWAFALSELLPKW